VSVSLSAIFHQTGKSLSPKNLLFLIL